MLCSHAGTRRRRKYTGNRGGVAAHHASPAPLWRFEYCIGTREIGHVHGDHLVDVPFPIKLRDELIASGKAEAHHVLPQTGWVSLYLREPGDVQRAIDLLKLSYEMALNQKEML